MMEIVELFLNDLETADYVCQMCADREYATDIEELDDGRFAVRFVPNDKEGLFDWLEANWIEWNDR